MTPVLKIVKARVALEQTSYETLPIEFEVIIDGQLFKFKRNSKHEKIVEKIDPDLMDSAAFMSNNHTNPLVNIEVSKDRKIAAHTTYRASLNYLVTRSGQSMYMSNFNISTIVKCAIQLIRRTTKRSEKKL